MEEEDTTNMWIMRRITKLMIIEATEVLHSDHMMVVEVDLEVIEEAIEAIEVIEVEEVDTMEVITPVMETDKTEDKD